MANELTQAMQGMSPAAVADAIFAAARGADDAPVWLDGGCQDAPPYRPGIHRLAAFPVAIERVGIQELPERSLTAWLRQRVPCPKAPAGVNRPPQAPMTVVGLSYDAGRNLESVSSYAAVDADTPDIVVATYAAFVEYDGHAWTLHSSCDAARARLSACLTNISKTPPQSVAVAPPPLTSNLTLAEYAQRHQELISSLEAGDLYQANLARRLETTLTGHCPRSVYASMRDSNPAAYGVLWRYAADNWIASSSPECLLSYEPDSRVVHSYPIKGTRRRGSDAAQDDKLTAELCTDPKERAEHVMIVDLVRNDLGRVCTPGSVTVPALFDLMQLPSVHHLVSDVQGRLHPRCDVFDLVGSLFPGGSITGAPKVAALNAIDRLEPARRGFYTGSIGVHLAGGAATYNILIRTCIIDGQRLRYSTGGGIVIDSTAEREWEETEEKAAALRQALAGTGNGSDA